MEKEIQKFLEQDKIDYVKLHANSEIMKNQTQEVYQATTKLHNQNDVSKNATKTIHWMALVYNQPLGLPKWFMTAYPDVVKWFSNLGDEMIISIIGNPNVEDMDEEQHFKLPTLRMVVEAYKLNNTLECS